MKNLSAGGCGTPLICYTYYIPASVSPAEIYRQEHLLGLALLQKGLKDFYQISLTFTELTSGLLKTKNGKPYLKDYPEVFFNISHCNGLVVCAFHQSATGADCELPGYFAPVLPDKILSAEEKTQFQKYGTDSEKEQEWFSRFWTLKEAYVKYTGTGVDTSLTSFSFFFPVCGFSQKESLQIPCSDSDVICFQRTMEGGQILSVCVAASSVSAGTEAAFCEYTASDLNCG